MCSVQGASGANILSRGRLLHDLSRCFSELPWLLVGMRDLVILHHLCMCIRMPRGRHAALPHCGLHAQKYSSKTCLIARIQELH